MILVGQFVYHLYTIEHLNNLFDDFTVDLTIS